MLATTDDEIRIVMEYMASQAPDLEATFVQKVYSETVAGDVHDIWDIHTDKDRWWVITNPTNLYSQEQFPNMDIALTFHLGLCIRIPRTERKRKDLTNVSPFGPCFRLLGDASESLSQAQELGDFQAVGVRCRETLLAFTDAAQKVLPWTSAEPEPKKADFKAWVDHVCAAMLMGSTHENRRHLFKTLLDAAWKFDNWLTHAKNSTWYDAEAAVSSTENALSMCVSTIYRHLRGVPDTCPNCGSSRLVPEYAHNPDCPDEIWERPACQKCDWHGTESLSKPGRKKKRNSKVKGNCSIQTVPLRKLKKPG